MKWIFYLFILLSPALCIAQQAVLKLNLHPTDSKKDTLPFYFLRVLDLTQRKDSMGCLKNQTSNKTEVTILENHLPDMLSIFLSKQYGQNKKGAPIVMKITQLGLYAKPKEKFTDLDTFKITCAFYRDVNHVEELLHSFKAKNVFEPQQNTKEILENAIGKAITVAVNKFALVFKEHPEWNEVVQIDLTKIQVKIDHNQQQEPNSIVCKKATKLSAADYPLTDRETSLPSAFTKLVLTYTFESSEANNIRQLDIHTKALMQKNQSWKMGNTNDLTWLSYQQGLFDLCTVYGYDLLQRMKTFSYTIGDYTNELTKICNQTNVEFQTDCKQYEMETKFGTDPIFNEKWRKKIDTMLLALPKE